MKILLVEPNFPVPNKSKHGANKVHRNFIPIGLLKLASFHIDKGDKVKLARGNVVTNFIPDEIKITSLFTYWSSHVWDSVQYYRDRFPNAKIEIGGIYASLLHKTKDFKEKLDKYNVSVFPGIFKDAENYTPAYDLIDSDYQVIHAMRGCIRKCKFCGTWKIEPEVEYKNANDVIEKIRKGGKNKVIFYDNNFLANPNAKEILKIISNFRLNGKPVIYESQSGFDGRLLDFETAKLIKKARFKYPRIAWDNRYSEWKSIKKKIDYLTRAGYSKKYVFVFMIYNFDIPFEELEKKRKKCKTWGVQIIDCRYRPLRQLYDNYNPQLYRKGQSSDDYYIHEKFGWTDKKIREFRKMVRWQNISIRYANGQPFDKNLAYWGNIKRLYRKAGIKKIPKIEEIKKSKKIQKQIEDLKKECPRYTIKK